MEIFLLRHGESIAKELNRRQIVSDPLSERGRMQALSVKKILPQTNIVYSSPYIRAVETANIVSENQPFVIHHNLRERDEAKSLYGSSKDSDEHNQYIAELKRNKQNILWRFNNGESIEDVAKRAIDAVNAITQEPYSSVLLVTHDYVIRSLLSHARNSDMYSEGFLSHFWSLRPKHCSLAKIEITDMKWKESAI